MKRFRKRVDLEVVNLPGKIIRNELNDFQREVIVLDSNDKILEGDEWEKYCPAYLEEVKN